MSTIESRRHRHAAHLDLCPPLHDLVYATLKLGNALVACDVLPNIIERGLQGMHGHSFHSEHHSAHSRRHRADATTDQIGDIVAKIVAKTHSANF